MSIRVHAVSGCASQQARRLLVDSAYACLRCNEIYRYAPSGTEADIEPRGSGRVGGLRLPLPGGAAAILEAVMYWSSG